MILVLMLDKCQAFINEQAWSLELKKKRPGDSPAQRNAEKDYFNASWTLPTSLAEGVRVLSPSSFHFDGHACASCFWR